MATWYESNFGKYAGMSLIVGVALGSCTLALKYRMNESITIAKQEYKIRSADLNSNDIPEKFYTIDDKVALVQVDGKPVMDFLRK